MIWRFRARQPGRWWAPATRDIHCPSASDGIAVTYHLRTAEAIVGLEQRVKTLEDRPPSVEWAGIWSGSKSYARGQLVSKSGLWLCLMTTAARSRDDPTRGGS
jgi:hypothetical protein